MALNVKEGEGRSSARAVSEAVSMMAQSGLVQVGGDSDIEGIEEEEVREEVVEELVEASEEEDELRRFYWSVRKKLTWLKRHRSLVERERTKCFGVGISWNWLISISRNFRRKLKRLYRSNDRSLIL
jgi:hypothetical protein